MSETIAATHPGRRWMILAMTGCGLVMLAMAVTALVIVDKPRGREATARTTRSALGLHE